MYKHNGTCSHALIGWDIRATKGTAEHPNVQLKITKFQNTKITVWTNYITNYINAIIHTCAVTLYYNISFIWVRSSTCIKQSGMHQFWFLCLNFAFLVQFLFFVNNLHSSLWRVLSKASLQWATCNQTEIV